MRTPDQNRAVPAAEAGTAQNALSVMLEMIGMWGSEGMYRSATKMLVDMMYMYNICKDTIPYEEIADSVEFCSMLIGYFEQLCPEQED